MANITAADVNKLRKHTGAGMMDCKKALTESDGDIEKAKEILLDIGYYRLGFYWHPFEVDKDHNLKQGTKFSDVVKLYYLDVDLKHILLKALNWGVR